MNVKVIELLLLLSFLNVIAVNSCLVELACRQQLCISLQTKCVLGFFLITGKAFCWYGLFMFFFSGFDLLCLCAMNEVSTGLNIPYLPKYNRIF